MYAALHLVLGLTKVKNIKRVKCNEEVHKEEQEATPKEIDWF